MSKFLFRKMFAICFFLVFLFLKCFRVLMGTRMLLFLHHIQFVVPTVIVIVAKPSFSLLIANKISVSAPQVQNHWLQQYQQTITTIIISTPMCMR